jgi:hypothetical protein
MGIHTDDMYSSVVAAAIVSGIRKSVEFPKNTLSTGFFLTPILRTDAETSKSSF